jgi:hypothetical protein
MSFPASTQGDAGKHAVAIGAMHEHRCDVVKKRNNLLLDRPHNVPSVYHETKFGPFMFPQAELPQKIPFPYNVICPKSIFVGGLTSRILV